MYFAIYYGIVSRGLFFSGIHQVVQQSYFNL